LAIEPELELLEVDALELDPRKPPIPLASTTARPPQEPHASEMATSKRSERISMPPRLLGVCFDDNVHFLTFHPRTTVGLRGGSVGLGSRPRIPRLAARMIAAVWSLTPSFSKT
jgi:hypothetical protein